ncbi:MAG: hypothetical protein EAX95_05040 [Candidatus Thorarchaeota archaeon]|nr:hypothetical protein [Candidatus Thorarchaeota archaeon]
MINQAPSKKSDEDDFEDVEVYTSKLYDLNIQAQDSAREFALHDIDDKEGIELKRIAMHDAYTQLYDAVAEFSDEIGSEEFDIEYLRSRLPQAEGEAKEQIDTALNELAARVQQNLADVWMSRVMAWLHQAAAASGPFADEDNEEKRKSASTHLARAYTMLERSFSAVPQKVDGTQKLRRVALGDKAYHLMYEGRGAMDKDLADLVGNNKTAEAEFYDEFLNELIGQESTFRQAFNPFDELIWRDILSSFIFEQATDLYNESIPYFMKNKKANKKKIGTIKAWKQNTAGLSEVYLAMTYNDIADAQMRAGNLEDASKLYLISSDAFARAEKCFRDSLHLQANAAQSANDKDQKKAQSLFCRAEASVQTLSDLMKLNNKQESSAILKEIFRDLRKAENLSKTRELTGAIKANLTTFSFVENLLKKKVDDLSAISDQIEFAKEIRKTTLIQNVSKALDEASSNLGDNPIDSLEAIREGLDNLGILLSLEVDDEEIGNLRNKTIALVNNVKYVIQFQLSSKLEQGVKFIQSRILENLHAAEAASYYKVIGEKAQANELTDLGRLALATAYASEAQVYAKQAEQWSFRTQMERVGYFREMDDEIGQLEDEDGIEAAMESHDTTLSRIKQAIAAFDSAANELASVKDDEIRRRNNVEGQVRQLQAVVMKFKGDLRRIEGAKSDFLAEVSFRAGDVSKAKIHYSNANDQLREAVGNYNTAAQVFQQSGDAQAAQTVDGRAKTTDLLARSIWDNRQRLERDQEPNEKGDAELSALYMGGGVG